MSAIVEYFKNKTIFLTGGTGFIGKLVIDQLLRKCEPKVLYLLIRNKKKDANTRAQDLFREVVFDQLRRKKPNFQEKIKIISGNLEEDDLGINNGLMKELSEEVEIVIHGAAVVKFNELLRIATNINVKGTISVIKFCKQITKLQAFVYVSTAFSNCPYVDVKEEFYEIHMNSEELLYLVENVNDKKLDDFLERILKIWPNTYTFTKAVAENAIKTYAGNLPVAIIRPSAVISTINEPVPGWIDNKYGPIGAITAVIVGALRTLNINPKLTAEMVPGDMVASIILAATYKRGTIGSSMKVPIYNFVAGRKNNITWGKFMNRLLYHSELMPPQRMLLPNYSFVFFVNNAFLNEICSFFMNFIPAVIIDVTYKIQGRTLKPSAISLYIILKKFMASLEYFGNRIWNFSNDNVLNLWADLSREDKLLFNFNVESIIWSDYFKDCYDGIRLYIFKETPDTIEPALIKYKWFKNVEKNVIRLFYGFLAILVLWIFMFSM